jgi:hypothetical protein
VYPHFKVYAMNSEVSLKNCQKCNKSDVPDTNQRARKYANGTWQQALPKDSYLNGIILTFIQFYDNNRNSKIIDRISALNPYH